MTTRVAINGFGRIGRLVLRAALESGRKDVEVVAINDLAPVATNAHLFAFDSVHGRFPHEVTSGEDWLDAGAGKIKALSEPDVAKLPWKELDIDVVLECTGRFVDRESASAHLASGAKRVLVSAPCKDADKTIVFGINHQELTAEDQVISNASCTTNCLAPVAKVLNEAIGIEVGYMTTVHAYTGDQNVVDSVHKDLRRSRAAAQSIIPTSTGAARAVGLVLPELAGKLDGTALRVPTPNVSVIDLTFTAANETDAETVNAAIVAAAKSEALKGVLAVNQAPLVSIDYNHNPASSVFDLTETQVVGGKLVRVMSWYDNEWGFSNRMLDTANAIGKVLKSEKELVNA